MTTPPALALPKTDLRQIEHDRLVAEQTPERYRHMIEGLGALACSKFGGG